MVNLLIPTNWGTGNPVPEFLAIIVFSTEIFALRMKRNELRYRKSRLSTVGGPMCNLGIFVACISDEQVDKQPSDIQSSTNRSTEHAYERAFYEIQSTNSSDGQFTTF